MERQQIVAVEEEDDLVLDSLLADCSIQRDAEPEQADNLAADRTGSQPRREALAAQRSAPVITCAEEDGSGRGGGIYPIYITPMPHRPGDHLRRSLHGPEAPPKSILRKTSSYASFSAADEGESASPERKSRRPLFPSMKSSSSVHSRGSVSSSSHGASVGLNLDLSNSAPRHYPRAPIRRSGSQPELVKRPKVGEGHPMRSRVSFNSVDVRSYDRCAGDNPSCRWGVPISLDWSYSKSSSVSLDEFELERSLSRGQKGKLRGVSKYQRRTMLLQEWDVKEEELKARRKETKRIQRERDMTRALIPVHRAHELVFSVKQRFKRRSSKSVSTGHFDDWSHYTEDMTVHSNSQSSRSCSSMPTHSTAFHDAKSQILSDRVVSFVVK